MKKTTKTSALNLASLELQLNKTGERCASLLIRKKIRIVLVESCTGGLVSATLTQTPGVSEVLAGSFVTYQSGSKSSWLSLPSSLLKAAPDGVSPDIAGSLAWNALKKTPHADLALTVTGRLGPSVTDEQAEQDGYAWLGLALQGEEKDLTRATAISFLPGQKAGKSKKAQAELRRARQLLAARGVLEVLMSLVKSLEVSDE